MVKKFLLLFLLLILSITNVTAQLSKKHYIPPLTSDPADPVTTQYIYISTPKATNVPYRIIPVGNPNIDAYSGVVSNDNPVAQPVLTSTGTSTSFTENSQLHIPLLNTGNIIRNKGFIIEADDLIYVSVRVRSTTAQDGVSKFQAGALVSKGSSALGTAFRIGGFRSQGAPIGGHATFASIMATEDDTSITIDDLPPGIVLVNPQSIPISANLNEGESYVIAVASNRGGDPKDLIGGLITSDKPVVVNIGSATGSFGEGLAGRDYGYDQIVGADKVGTEYILVRGDGNNPWENALIVAHENNTEVFVNGSSRTLLNAGQHIVLEGTDYTFRNNMYIRSSRPVFVYQGIGGIGPSGGPEEPNQGLFFVPPLSCESVGDVDHIAFIDSVDESGDVFSGGVTIVTNTGAEVLINDEPIATYNVTPSTVTGNPDYVTYRVTGLTGSVSVSSDKELYCAYFNGNGFATTGSFYSGFLSPEIEFNSSGSSTGGLDLIGNCIPNVTLEVTNANLLENFEWQYYNEDTKTWEFKSDQESYVPIEEEPGRYRVIGNIQCTGSPFESPEVIVSVCPDDFDGDLIIDNLDVDIDNDGILNVDESRGDVIIDLSDITTPVLKFNDGTTDNTFVTATPPLDLTINSFTGSPEGNFSSNIGGGATSDNTYSLSFEEPVNVKITPHTLLANTIAGNNYFTFKITPNDQNITLLDPDDQILVDTDFDGDFDDEFPVTYISASEIRFKFKLSLPPNQATYQFIANEITEITFEHQIGGTQGSSFNANIALVNFSQDTDKDGIPDYKDLDSDNDGIPDTFEYYGEFLGLSNQDSNDDGLDNVFDGISSSFDIDLDGDGVPNHLDLDSDNDGVYDIFEAGHNQNDNNLDGRLDATLPSSFGENGWLDVLETAAESGVLNYIVIDTDEDGLFNFIDLDSDEDDCFDVTEAGFTGDTNGILTSNPFGIDENGKVLNSDGYQNPNPIYIENGTISYELPEEVEICENSGGSILVDSNADSFQWEISLDNGNTWNAVRDDNTYSGTTTNELVLSNVTPDFNNYLYRVLLNREAYGCDDIPSTPVVTQISELPVIEQFSVEINECISVLETNPTISLRGAESLISTTPGAIFRYYDNATATNEIENPDNYPFNPNTTEDFWVRVFSDKGCPTPGTVSLRINVGGVTPEIELGIQAVECDDFTIDPDTSRPIIGSNTDLITQFSIDYEIIKNEIITAAGINEDVTIEFYQNLQDRTNSVDEIEDIENFRNDSSKNETISIPNGIQFPIYFKIVSSINNFCQGLGSFQLQIDKAPEAFPVPDIELCDDVLSGDSRDGKTANINLRNYVDELLGQNQTETNFKVTFHTSIEGSSNVLDSDLDLITNDTDYTNEVPNSFQGDVINEQEIFVRIEDKDRKCINADISFKIMIYPIPTVPSTVTDLLVCDTPTLDDSNPRNRTTQHIDLTTRTNEILGGRTGYRVAYFTTETNAENLVEISNPDDFTSIPNLTAMPADESTDDPGIQTIYYRVIDESGIQCPSLVASFNLVIYPEPNIEPISALEECDNPNDGDDTNGRIQFFDLASKRSEILGNRNATAHEITFHSSSTDADLGQNALPLIYSNTNPTETIYVRMVQLISGCVNSNASFTLKVNTLPDYFVISPQIICMNDLPYTMRVENPQEEYTYVWTDEAGNEVGQNAEVPIYQGGNYTVTATNPITGCIRIETIEVNESNVAILEPDFVEIIDDLNSTNNEYSVRIDTVTNDLGIGDYEFAILNTDTNERFPFAGFQDEPFFELEGGGVYQIIVNDKNGCVPPTTLVVSVIEFPKFFTPNGDDINDFWTVKGANVDFYPNSSINIFNRFGKLLAKVPLDSQGWDGTYQGAQLPSDDYWYKITLVPADPSKPIVNRTSHFSLIRN